MSCYCYFKAHSSTRIKRIIYSILLSSKTNYQNIFDTTTAWFNAEKRVLISYIFVYISDENFYLHNLIPISVLQDRIGRLTTTAPLSVIISLVKEEISLRQPKDVWNVNEERV